MSNPPILNFTNISLPTQIPSQVPFFTSDLNSTTTSQKDTYTRTQWAYELPPDVQSASIYSRSQQRNWQSKYAAQNNASFSSPSKKKSSHQKPVTSSKKQNPINPPTLPTPKIDWDMPFHEREMYPIIQRIAYGLPGETDCEAFIDGCRRSVTFYRSAQWVARWYYAQSQDLRWDPKVRKGDLERAMRLKASMEEARRESLKNLFRVEKGRRVIRGPEMGRCGEIGPCANAFGVIAVGTTVTS
jgi:hypothetical protein